MKNFPRMRAYLVGLLSLVVLSGCGSLWESDEDRKFKPAELETFTPAITVTTLWEKSLPEVHEDERLKLTPSYSGGVLFTAGLEGRVEAHDASNGATRWSVDTDLPLSGGPGVGDAMVLVGSQEGDLVALDELSGKKKWQVRLSSELLSSPTADRGVVVAYTQDGRLHGLASVDGRTLWTYDRPTPALTLHGSSSPVAIDGRVVCGFANGRVAALNLITGDPLWESSITLPSGRTDLERMVDIDGDPVVRDGVVFVATYQGDLAALSLDSGAVFWRKQLSSHEGLAVSWRMVFAVDADDQLWAVDPRSGAAVWKVGGFDNRHLSPPAVMGDQVVVGDLEGYVHWISQLDGRKLARVRVGDDPITLRPLVADDRVFVLGSGGKLAALTVAPVSTTESADGDK